MPSIHCFDQTSVAVFAYNFLPFSGRQCWGYIEKYSGLEAAALKPRLTVMLRRVPLRQHVTLVSSLPLTPHRGSWVSW